MTTGPLAGVRVVELAGIGPGPFCGLMLADMGADVLRVDRPGYRSPANPVPPEADLLNRGRASVAVDLKSARGPETVLRLVESADIVFEGFRPGVAERLGIGPDACLARNPRLVYGRMTGWGREGAMASRAGHDINYIGLSGALAAIGTADTPVPPLNLVGDFGGGGLLLAFGLLCGLHVARSTGRGQVVDASIVDGASLLMTVFHALRGYGWTDRIGSNLLDGGAHFYSVYRCADARHAAVGAIEPQFYAALLAGLGLADDPDLRDGQADRVRWPMLRERLAARFRERPSHEWLAVFARQRRVRVRGRPARRGTDTSARPRARLVRHCRRSHAAGARSAVQPHPTDGPRSAAAPRSAHPQRPGALGVRPGRDRRPCERRHCP